MLLLILHQAFFVFIDFRVFSCRVPCAHVPARSLPLFKARQLMRDVIEARQGEKTS
ncbi:MAG: hypothetical protein ACJA2P_000635 [Rhodoferax sp.]